MSTARQSESSKEPAGGSSTVAGATIGGYRTEPWELRRHGFDLNELQRTESVFALSNGHIGMRGTLDEGEPRGLPGTYLNGFYEEHPLPYAESGYGYPEAGQTVVNVADGKLLRLLLDDEPLDLRYGAVQGHEQVLDLRSGTVRRSTDWISPTHRRVRVRSERLVSFTQRAVAAIRYEVEPLDRDVQLVVQSDLLVNEPIESGSDDPRVAAAMSAPLEPEFATCDGYRAVLAHRTRNSGLCAAAAMGHDIQCSAAVRTQVHAESDLARLSVAVDVPRGETLRLTKFLGYGWSSQRSVPALRAQVEAALTGALRTGWDGLLAEQRQFLDEFWDAADVRVDGDAAVQHAVRFALFQVLQAGARGESRGIPAKGLTGPGYDGHSFWEAETFVLPVLTYAMPEAARDALRWRHSTVDRARRRARTLGLRGAAFPWRTINGDECSAYWPAGTAAFHVNADIADAVVRYVAATGDTEFEWDYGLELLVETARLWHSCGQYDAEGGFRIDGVTGPDEYTAVVDNNIYTNLMAQRNLTAAAAACARHPDLAGHFGVDREETAAWRDAARAVLVPYSAELGVHAQSEGFTEHADWDFSATPAANYPLLLHYPYFDLYRKQVVKQADLVLALYLRGDAFDERQKARDFAYYEARTVRDSSLSAPVQAVLAAEVGHLDLAYDYLRETARTDLDDLHDNVRNGLHIGALAGVWHVLVAGFGGMRDHDGRLTFRPRLPAGLRGIGFGLRVRDSRISVDISQDAASYALLDGPPVTVTHHGREITVGPGEPVTLPIPPAPQRPAPEQPAGRPPGIDLDRRE